jgi:hypothetical protein
MSQNEPRSRRSGGSNITVGIMCMLMGGLVIAIATGVIHTDPSKINAPTWVLVIFGLSFVMAGVCSIFQSAVRYYDADTPLMGWTNFAFALLLMLTITLICQWIGFGPGADAIV